MGLQIANTAFLIYFFLPFSILNQDLQSIGTKIILLELAIYPSGSS
jgi:hypothetical protein